MNLQSEIREVRSRVADPARVDPNDSYILDIEVMDWLWRGETQLLHDILEREKVAKILSIPSVASTELYSITVDLLDIIRVTYAGTECTRYPVEELGALTTNRFRVPVKGQQQYFYILSDTAAGVVPGRTRIGIQPIPDDTSNIIIYYIPMPTRRFKANQGTTTGAGSSTTMVDSLLIQPDDYWNGTQIRLLSGYLKGNAQVVTDFTNAGAIILTAAWPATPGTNTQYEIGEISSIPQEYIPLSVAWASYQALLKDRRPEEAGAQKTLYDSLLGNINGRYGFKRTEPAREMVG